MGKVENIRSGISAIDEQFKKIKCNCCGMDFIPTKEIHYIAGDQHTVGLAAAFSAKDQEPKYDAFDCPNCGTQCIMGDRKETLFEYTKSQDNMLAEKFEHDKVNDIRLEEESAASDSEMHEDNKKFILAGLIGARIEMREKHELSRAAMIAIVDAIIYQIAGDKLPEGMKADTIGVIKTERPKCFGTYEKDIDEKDCTCQMCDISKPCMEETILREEIQEMIDEAGEEPKAGEEDAENK